MGDEWNMKPLLDIEKKLNFATREFFAYCYTAIKSVSVPRKK